MHEGGFAGAGFADDGDGFTFVYFEVDILEGVELSGFFAIGFGEVFGFE